MNDLFGPVTTHIRRKVQEIINELNTPSISRTSTLTFASTGVIDMPVSAAGAGYTAGGVIHAPSGKKGTAGLIITEIYVDLKTGAVSSSTTDLDIIGKAAGGAAYISQITAALHGAIQAITMTCLEVPATGVTDIDLYSATEATGVFDGGVAALTETAIITAGGAWTLGLTKAASALPTANEYLYLTGGAAGTPGAYSAGKFLIRIYGK